MMRLQKPFVLAVVGLATALIGNASAVAQAPAFGMPTNQDRGNQDRILDDTDVAGALGVMESKSTEVKHINMVEVPASSEGILKSLDIEEGDLVTKDDLIGTVDDETAQLTVDLKKAEDLDARIKAKNNVNLLDAQNNKRLADAEAKMYVELERDGAVPYWEMRRKQLEAEKQGLRIQLAELDTQSLEVQVVLKATELKLAEAELKKRQIMTPLTGYVEERIAQEGQWVQPGSPIAKIIQMDRLRVEGYMDGLSYPNKITKGVPAKVLITTSDQKETAIDGKLGYVSMQLNNLGQYRVWVEIENRRVGDDWMFKPGMEARIQVPVN